MPKCSFVSVAPSINQMCSATTMLATVDGPVSKGDCENYCNTAQYRSHSFSTTSASTACPGTCVIDFTTFTETTISSSTECNELALAARADGQCAGLILTLVSSATVGTCVLTVGPVQTIPGTLLAGITQVCESVVCSADPTPWPTMLAHVYHIVDPIRNANRLPTVQPIKRPVLSPATIVKCIDVELVDLFGLGWDSARVLIYKSDRKRLELAPSCQENPLFTTVCFDPEADHDKAYVVLKVVGFAPVRPWAIFWRVSNKATGEVYVGDYDSTLTFQFQIRYEGGKTRGITDTSLVKIHSESLVTDSFYQCASCAYYSAYGVSPSESAKTVHPTAASGDHPHKRNVMKLSHSDSASVGFRGVSQQFVDNGVATAYKSMSMSMSLVWETNGVVSHDSSYGTAQFVHSIYGPPKYFISSSDGDMLVSGSMCSSGKSACSVQLQEGEYVLRVTGGLQGDLTLKWTFCGVSGRQGYELKFSVLSGECIPSGMDQYVSQCSGSSTFASSISLPEAIATTFQLKGVIQLQGVGNEMLGDGISIIQQALVEELSDSYLSSSDVSLDAVIISLVSPGSSIKSSYIDGVLVEFAVTMRSPTFDAYDLKAYLGASMTSGLFVTRLRSLAVGGDSMLQGVYQAALLDLESSVDSVSGDPNVAKISFFTAMHLFLVFSSLSIIIAIFTVCHFDLPKLLSTRTSQRYDAYSESHEATLSDDSSRSSSTFLTDPKADDTHGDADELQHRAHGEDRSGYAGMLPLSSRSVGPSTMSQSNDSRSRPSRPDREPGWGLAGDLQQQHGVQGHGVVRRLLSSSTGSGYGYSLVGTDDERDVVVTEGPQVNNRQQLHNQQEQQQQQHQRRPSRWQVRVKTTNERAIYNSSPAHGTPLHSQPTDLSTPTARSPASCLPLRLPASHPSSPTSSNTHDVPPSTTSSTPTNTHTEQRGIAPITGKQPGTSKLRSTTFT